MYANVWLLHAEILLIFAAWLLWFHTRMTSDTSVSVSGVAVGPRSTRLSLNKVLFDRPRHAPSPPLPRKVSRVDQS